MYAFIDEKNKNKRTMYALKIFSDVLKERIFILVKGVKWTNFIKEAYGAMYWRFFVCEKGGYNMATLYIII